MRNFLNAIKGVTHAEERPLRAASRSTHTAMRPISSPSRSPRLEEEFTTEARRSQRIENRFSSLFSPCPPCLRGEAKVMKEPTMTMPEAGVAGDTALGECATLLRDDFASFAARAFRELNPR